MKRLITVLLCILSVLYLVVPAFANAPGPNLDGTHEVSPFWIISLIIVYLIIVAVTCFVEWLVSIPFLLHYIHTRAIIVTNLVTQVVMHLLEYVTALLMPENIYFLEWYPVTVIVLEVFVYISEYLIYCKVRPGVSRKKLLLYTVCANTASLALGLLLLQIIL